MLIRVEKVQIPDQIPRNDMMEKHIEENASLINKQMDAVCGYFDVDIEGRFEVMRA